MDSRRLRIGCEFRYRAEVATAAVFQVQPLPEEAAWVTDETWAFEPEPSPPPRHYRDLYGNSCLRLVLPAGTSRMTYAAVATVPDEPESADESAAEVAADQLPDDVLLYTLPSRYCLPDMLADEAWTQFGEVPAGYTRVQAINQYVHDYLTFRYGASTATSTAVDVFATRGGVCRDFTHLAITFCRALNIPARYVFGYLPDMDVPPDPAPMDFAAWMEVWLGDRWWTFDPRNNQPRKGRVLIGRGRDAGDVAMATTFGGPVLESMTVVAEEVEGAAREEVAV